MHKYVVLGNENDWLDVMLYDFKNKYGAKIINSEIPYNKNKFIYKIMHLHFSKKINLPFKKIWFKLFCKYICSNRKEDLYLIIYDRNRLANNSNFLKYLRNYYDNLKMIYIFTNIVKFSGAMENSFVDKLSNYYDLVYAFDHSDSIKYNFKYHGLIYSIIKNDNIKAEKKVFYVGKAKDRYSMLIDVYKKFDSLKINTEFYIFGVDEKKQKYNDKIKYNQYIPYKKCLEKIQSSTVLLDVIQGDSEGFTIKVCEAVYYDKLLITTNKNVLSEPFYNPENILVINTASDITKEFFENKDHVKYPDEGKYIFSIEHFINTLEDDILHRNGENEND